MGWLQQLRRQALAANVLPGSAGAEALVRELLDDRRPSPPNRRSVLAEHLETFTDGRVERHWMLLGELNIWPAW